MKKCSILILALIMIALSTSDTVNADTWDDEDTPISFKIEMIPWEKANEIIPLKMKFTIIDFETGLHFRVQRRAGRQHADVQPLTKEDTKIMKEIYNGKWSWKRRAIIVLVGDQMIAASMHGMPHGAGALRNGFPGHFCVHFSGSITHRTKHEDLSHQVMILKAAGKLEEYFDTLKPTEIIKMFAVAVNQDDEKILNQTITKPECPDCFNELISNISYFDFRFLEENFDEINTSPIAVEIPVKATYFAENEKRKKELRFVIIKDYSTGRWRIDATSLYNDLH